MRSISGRELCRLLTDTGWTLKRIKGSHQDGEIRGRKLVPALGKAQTVRPVKFKDLLILPQDIEVDFDEWDRQLRKDREERDGYLLG